MKPTVIALLLFTFLAAGVLQAADTFVVTTKTGQVRGTSRPPNGAEFLGIPFAQPPVGNLRWREPAPMSPWSGVRDAQTFGAPCAQAILGDWNRRDAESGKEDCLFLNVMTPVWPPKDKLPVMVWLHGGANAGGTASSALYKDGTLVEHGVVLVTANYRLGVFGFLAHPALTHESVHHASGNYGLLDQIAALHWVKDNISKFGGDPDNITLFGQSAGAIDASFLMTSPLAKGLFHRVIAESGSAFRILASLSQAEKAGEELARNLKAPAGGALEYLREVSPQDLLHNLPAQDPAAPPLIGPVVDNYVLPRQPGDVFDRGEEAPVPLMIGTNTREFGTSAPPEALRQWIGNVTGDLAPKMLALYGLAGGGKGTSDPVYGAAGDQWFADLAFRCPASMQATSHAAAHHPVFQYEFQRIIPGHEAEGSVHSMELSYVFGYRPKSGNLAGQYNGTDDRIADWIQRYWTVFAKTGNPNGGSLPDWPAFAPARSLLQLTNDGRAEPITGGLRKAQCDVLSEALRHQLESYAVASGPATK